MKLSNVGIILFILLSINTYGQEVTGKWFGLLKGQGFELHLVFNIVKNQSGYTTTMDSPDQGAKGIPVNTTSFENSVLKFEISTAKIEYQGTLQNNNTVTGTFKQAGQVFELNLSREEPKEEKKLGKDLNIKSINIDLKGTILIPENDKIKKLVLFVHGSGRNDRDETVIANKPFKDIAEGLYAKGIASYRFDKRTFSNPETFNEKSTIDDEVTNDILNIVTYFKTNTQYKDYQIIIIGHSLGAHLAPRIANKSNDINKIVLLAGNARPLQELLIEQYKYLNKINPSKEMEAEELKLKDKVAFLNSKSFDLNTPKEKLPLGIPANYWKSMLDYNPIKEIQKVKIPILILQGERDYQVTMEDFNLWKKALNTNKKAGFISYPKLNHLFITGENPSDPKEYSLKGNVDVKVINDVNDFINSI